MSLPEPGTGRPRRVVVVGASSGIGAATGRAFHAAGWSVVLAARRQDRLAALADEITKAGGPSGADVSTTPIDVTDDGSVTEMAGGLAPGIDALVYCAGLALGAEPVAAIDPTDFDRVLSTSVLGLARVVRALRGHLAAGPATTIVVVTSMSGHTTYPRGGSYAAAKHAQVALADTLAQELRADGLRVVEVAPGVVRTEFAVVMNRGDVRAAELSYAHVEPLHPADVADCILWAVSRPEQIDIRSVTIAPRLRRRGRA